MSADWTQNGYEIRTRAEGIVGEDRVPSGILLGLIAQFGDEQEAAEAAAAVPAPGVRVTVDRSDEDGVPVVFVDTDEDVVPHDDEFHGPRLRIRLNDHLLYGLVAGEEKF